MQFFLSLLPILVILILMIGFRWGAARSGGAGYLSALVIAKVAFGAGPVLLAVAHMKALLLAVDVLLIIWAAFLLYRVVDEAGTINTLSEVLPKFTPDRGMQAIIIGWVFASFLQGVGGFGVPVAVVAPILIGLGFSPLSAIIVPSIGHGWSITFGSLGSSFNALLAATGVPEAILAPLAALYLGIACLISGFMVVQVTGGLDSIRRLFLPILVIGVVMALVQYFVVTNGLWYLGSFFASLAGIVVLLFFTYRQNIDSDRIIDRGDFKKLSISIIGYLLLIIVTLSIQLVPPINNFFNQIKFEMIFPEVTTADGFTTPSESGRQLSLLGHTGMILFYASVLSYLTYQGMGLYQKGSKRHILATTATRVMASSVSIASMVAMTVIMQHAGMIEILAQGMASKTGRLFPIVAPWIGAIGAFMTGSNTNSNVVFGALQYRTAELLGYSVMIILGAQTAGAAIASIIAPTKVVVGASAIGMAGKEGHVLRNLAVYVVILLIIIAIISFIGVRL